MISYTIEITIIIGILLYLVFYLFSKAMCYSSIEVWLWYSTVLETEFQEIVIWFCIIFFSSLIQFHFLHSNVRLYVLLDEYGHQIEWPNDNCIHIYPHIHVFVSLSCIPTLSLQKESIFDECFRERETSFPWTNPSVRSALHRALIVFWLSSACNLVV